MSQLVAHAALGCGLGALSGGDCKSGALGGVVGEAAGLGYKAITADKLAADITALQGAQGLPPAERQALVTQKVREWKAAGVDIARLSGALAAAMSGTDPNTAVLTAENAAKNNAVFTTAVVVVAAINAVSIGWSAYDVYQAYKKGGVESAVEQLAVEGLIAVPTVGAGKVVYKIGGIAFKSAADAWAYYAKSDKAFALVEKAAAATKAAGATVERAAERLLPRASTRKLEELKAILRAEEIKASDARVEYRSEDPAIVNRRFTKEPGAKPPYDATKPVASFVTGTEEEFTRVYAEGSTSKITGSWMMKKSDILGLSPAQIRNKYALPQIPDHIVDVRVPKGVKMETGTAASIPGWGEGGGRQFQLRGTLPRKKFETLFYNPRKLK